MAKPGTWQWFYVEPANPVQRTMLLPLPSKKGTPGFSAGKKENKLGMRASETTELIFDNCRISDAQRLGEIGEGFKQAMKILDGGRISIAALALGIAKGAFEASVKYAEERQQFDQPIANFQAIQWKLADMATQIEAAELLIYQAADLLIEENELPNKVPLLNIMPLKYRYG